MTSSERIASLLRLVRDQQKERFLRWTARQIQPYLEPGTMISHVNVQNFETAPAFQITDDGIILGKGTRIQGGDS